MTTNRKMLRQGDVLLVPVEGIPADAASAERDEANRIVLAVGEKSGHAHAIRDASVTAFRNESAAEDPANRALVDFIMVGGSGATLKHEYVDERKADHEPIALAPGAYRVVQQRTYSAPPKRAIAPTRAPQTTIRAMD